MNAPGARLFLGLELSEEARRALDGVRRELQSAGLAGKYHAPPLYHLTLCFLGNTPFQSIPALKRLMDSVSSAPFELTLSSLGTFKNGAILWAGVQPNSALVSYQMNLARALREAGFAIEEGEYHPHITLARQVKGAAPDIPVPGIAFQIRHATLFESTRMDGALTYLPLYRSVFH